MLWRISKFVAVGLACYGIQLGIIVLAEALIHVHIFWIGIVAFFISAQCNYVLSRFFTWRDRLKGQSHRRAWLKFNATVLTGSVINAMALSLFTFLLPFSQWLLVFGANVASSIVTFVCNHFIVFAQKNRSENGTIPGILPARLQ